VNTTIRPVAVALCSVVLALAMAAGTASATTSPIGAQSSNSGDPASQVANYGTGSSRTAGTGPVQGAEPGRGTPCGSAPKRNSPPSGPRGNRPEGPSTSKPALSPPQSAQENGGSGPATGAAADSTKVPLGARASSLPVNVDATTSETTLGDAVSTTAPIQPENQTFQEPQATEQDPAVPVPRFNQESGAPPPSQSSQQDGVVGSVAAAAAPSTQASPTDASASSPVEVDGTQHDAPQGYGSSPNAHAQPENGQFPGDSTTEQSAAPPVPPIHQGNWGPQAPQSFPPGNGLGHDAGAAAQSTHVTPTGVSASPPTVNAGAPERNTTQGNASSTNPNAQSGNPEQIQ
jgi:hypothetical protein